MATKTATHASDITGTAREPSREEIEKRAYQRYCDRGYAPGGELDDWLTAEKELSAEYSAIEAGVGALSR